jgi:hypothetical protein
MAFVGSLSAAREELSQAGLRQNLRVLRTEKEVRDRLLLCQKKSPWALRPMTKNEILIQLSESGMAKFGKEDFAQQPLPQKVFSAIWEIESEVNNGGFSQYFSNDSAESASFVVQALETIGAPRTANICSRAIVTAFPGELPATVEGIHAVAREFSEGILAKLEPLDQEFFLHPHNLTDLLFAYVTGHPEEFGTLAKPDDA